MTPGSSILGRIFGCFLFVSWVNADFNMNLRREVQDQETTGRLRLTTYYTSTIMVTVYPEDNSLNTLASSEAYLTCVDPSASFVYLTTSVYPTTIDMESTIVSYTSGIDSIAQESSYTSDTSSIAQESTMPLSSTDSIAQESTVSYDTATLSTSALSLSEPTSMGSEMEPSISTESTSIEETNSLISESGSIDSFDSFDSLGSLVTHATQSYSVKTNAPMITKTVYEKTQPSGSTTTASETSFGTSKIPPQTSSWTSESGTIVTSTSSTTESSQPTSSVLESVSTSSSSTETMLISETSSTESTLIETSGSESMISTETTSSETSATSSESSESELTTLSESATSNEPSTITTSTSQNTWVSITTASADIESTIPRNSETSYIPETVLINSGTSGTQTSVQTTATSQLSSPSGSLTSTTSSATLASLASSTSSTSLTTSSSTQPSTSISITSTGPLPPEASRVPQIINTQGFNQIAHIAFNNELKYQDVVDRGIANELFTSLSIAVAQALQLNDSEVLTERIWGSFNPKWNGQLQTIADVNVPRSMLDDLQSQILAENSSFYKNQTNKAANGYVQLVDRSVPVSGPLSNLDLGYDRRTSVKVILATVLGAVGASVLLGIGSYLLNVQTLYMKNSLDTEKGRVSSTIGRPYSDN